MKFFVLFFLKSYFVLMLLSYYIYKDDSEMIGVSAIAMLFVSFWIALSGFIVKLILNIKKKIKQTLTTNYGVDSPLKNEHIKKKMHNTCLERYGNISPIKTSEILKRSEQTNLEKYGRSNYMLSHIEDSNYNIYSDFDNLKKLYEEMGSIHKVANELNIASSTVRVQLHRMGIDVNPPNSSSYEKEICDFLDQHGITYRTSDRDIISPYELDIVIDSAKLAIEFNDYYWHSTLYKRRNYHKEKTKMVNETGYSIIHIHQDQWCSKKELLKEKILYKCNKSNKKRIYARSCDVNKINCSETLREFYDNNHLQGYAPCSLNYGLFYKDKLVACMSFKQTNVENVYYLSRYATSEIVIGGFSKLFKRFDRDVEYKECVTYANMDYSKGELYQNNGFELLGEIGPNYFYVKNNKRYSRQWAMKSKLVYKLDVFDPNKSEYQNMMDNGFLKVYDSGSLKYVFYKQ